MKKKLCAFSVLFLLAHYCLSQCQSSGSLLIENYSNSVGQVVRTTANNSNNTNIEISSLESGIYFIQVSYDGKEIIRKLVKK